MLWIDAFAQCCEDRLRGCLFNEGSERYLEKQDSDTEPVMAIPTLDWSINDSIAGSDAAIIAGGCPLLGQRSYRD